MNDFIDESTTDFYGNSLVSENEFAKVRQTGYSVELSDTLSKGWKLVQRNIGLLIGFCLVAFVIVFIVSALLSFIPVLGGLANTAFTAIIVAGFYAFFIKYHKTQFATFSDFFESFQDAVQLGLYGLISALISYIPAIIIGVIVFVIVAVIVSMNNFSGLEGIENGDFGAILRNGFFMVAIFIAFILIMIPLFLISMCYSFAPIIIITHKKEFWAAMELSRKLVMKNMSGNIELFFVLGLINFVGMIPLGLGLLVTIPLSFATIFVLYVKLLQKNGEDTSFGSNFYGNEDAPLDAL